MKLLFPRQFPVLETERLSLRMIRGNDAQEIFSLYSDPRVMEFRGAPVFISGAEAEELVFSWRKLFATGNGIRWGIAFRETEKLIGTIGFKTIFHQHHYADAGYELSPALWNKNIMTEALRAVTDFGLQKMDLHAIEANIAPEHAASKRVLEKLGFREEAHFHENYYYQNWWNSSVWRLKKQ